VTRTIVISHEEKFHGDDLAHSPRRLSVSSASHPRNPRRVLLLLFGAPGSVAHSLRSASIGSACAALLAGMYIASSATITSNAAVVMNVSGSLAFTP
jgi:hypothetical protein